MARATRARLSDKYLQFFAAKETAVAGTALEEFSYDTGMSPRGGWLWEIHMMEIKVSPDPHAPASANVNSQALALSFVSGAGSIPDIDDYGCIWRRDLRRIGNGTNAMQYWYEPRETVFYLRKPVLYAKKLLYMYYKQDHAFAASLLIRIGYVTKPASGALLWEVVEQYMSSAT